MPGLVGFVKDISHEQAKTLLQSMAYELDADQRFTRHLHTDGQVGLGRVSLEILNPGPQPVWNDIQNVGICLEGEFFDTYHIKQELVNKGYVFKNNSDMELALHLYEEFGDAFAEKLNGAFLIAIWDDRNKKLLVTNDRLGLYPLYYSETQDGLIFASGVRALLADQKSGPQCQPCCNC